MAPASCSTRTAHPRVVRVDGRLSNRINMAAPNQERTTLRCSRVKEGLRFGNPGARFVPLFHNEKRHLEPEKDGLQARGASRLLNLNSGLGAHLSIAPRELLQRLDVVRPLLDADGFGCDLLPKLGDLLG
jgi:hypothetical protein